MALDLYIKDEIAPQAIRLQEGGTPPEGYILNNSIEAWGLNQKNQILSLYDYGVVRSRLQDFLVEKTWETCSDEEKLILIRFNLYSQRRIISFVGTGIDDFSVRGAYAGGETSAIFEVVIDDIISSPNTFKWRKDGGAFTTGVSITGANQLISEGVEVEFEDADNHTLNDQWTINCINNNSSAEKVGFLMSPAGGGMTLEGASNHLRQMFAEQHKSSIIASHSRIEADEIYTTIAKFLNFEDAVDFFRKVRNLQIDFREQAIFGSRWGSSSSGLGDYIMGIDGYIYSGLPSQNYSLLSGTLAEFQTALMDVLDKGEYKK